MPRPKGTTKYSPTELGERIDQYIDFCADNQELPNIPELQAYLGIHDDTWGNYAKRNHLFLHHIKRAEKWCEAQVTHDLIRDTTGKIFYLKNKHGWSDMKTVKHEGQINHAHIHAELDQRVSGALGVGEPVLIGPTSEDDA